MTSRWPQQEPTFTGKRVAVIGTGSSGIQVISVANEAGQLYVLQRTPSYTIPLQNHPVDRQQVTKLKENYSALRAAIRFVCRLYLGPFRAGATALAVRA